MDAFRTRLTALLCAGLLLTLPNTGRAADPLPEPFLTRAELKEVTINGKKEKRWVPTTDRIAFGWSDQPFAVHIPFDLKMKTVMGRPGAGPDGAPAQSFKVNATKLQWHIRGFAAPAVDDSGSNPTVLSSGLYRLDGQPPLTRSPEPQVFLGFPSPPNLDRKSQQTTPPAQMYLDSAPAGEGRYGYWVVLDPSRLSVTHWKQFDESAGSIHAVVSEEGFPTTIESKLPVVVRQNGWQIESAKEVLLGDWKKEVGKGWTAVDVKTAWTGGVLSSAHRLSTAADTTEVLVEWKLPATIRDHRNAASGVEIRQTSGGKHPKDSRYGLGQPSVRVWTTPFTDDANAVAKTGPDGHFFGFEKKKAYHQFFTPDFTQFDRNGSLDKTTGLHKHAWPFELTGGRRDDPKFNSAPPELTADRKVGVHRLYALDVSFDSAVRPRPVDAPVKRIEVFARRASEITDNRKGKTTIEAARPTADANDGYWAWKDSYDDLVAKNLGQFEVVLHELQHLSAERRAKRRVFLTLLRLDQAALPPGPGVSADWGFGKTVYHSLLDWRGRSIPLGLTEKKAILDQMRAEREKLKVEIGTIRPRQEKLVEEGLRLMTALDESVEKQIAASRGVRKRPDLKEKAEATKRLYAFAKLTMYDAAEWYAPEELQKVIDENRFGDSTAKELVEVVMAKVAVARATHAEEVLVTQLAGPNPPAPDSPAAKAATQAQVEAMKAVLELVRRHPGNQVARMMLVRMELLYLDAIARKLDNERQLTLAGFREYLKNRGFDAPTAPAPKQPDRGVVLEGFDTIGNTYALPFEVLFNLLSNGMSIFGNGVPHPTLTLNGSRWVDKGVKGVPTKWVNQPVVDQLEGEVARTQDQLAARHVSLMLIQKLVRAGLPLAKARTLTPTELEQWVDTRTFGGQKLDPDKALRLCQDIRETFDRLDDLRALTEGKPEEFFKHLGTSYYVALDPSKSWTEWTGDVFLNPISLLLWNMGGVMVSGGRSFGLMGGAEIALLEEAGKLQRVQGLFVQGLRLEALAARMEQSKAGRLVLDLFAEDMAFYETIRGGSTWGQWGLNAARRTAFTAPRAAVELYFFATVAHAAHDVPGLRLMVDLLAGIGPHAMVYDVLARRGLKLKYLESQFAQFDPLVQSARADLEALSRAGARMEAIRSSLKSGSGRPSEADVRELDAIVAIANKKAATEKVGNNPLAEVHKTAADAAVALKTGDAAEAARALSSLAARQKKLDGLLKEFESNLKKAREVLAKRPPTSPPPKGGPDLGVGAETPRPLVPTELPPAGPHTTLVEQGDLALLRGEPANAKTLYEYALTVKRDLGLPDPKGLVEQRLALAHQVEQVATAIARKRAKAPAGTADLPITPEAETLLAVRLARGEVVLVYHPGSANPVYFVQEVATGQKVFVLKKVAHPDDLAGELVGAQLLRELGIKTPANRAVKFPKAKHVKVDPVTGAERVVEGEVEGVLFRYLDGDEVWALTDVEVLAVKADLAAQRAARLWLGDADGHLRNIVLGKDGHVWMLDLGYSHFHKSGGFPQFNANDMLGVDRAATLTQEQMLQSLLKFPKAKNQNPLYGWLEQLDGVMSYNEMEQLVGKIKVLSSKDGGKGLREALERSGLPADQVKEAFEVLMGRANALEKVLQGKYPTVTKPGGASLPRSSGSRLLLPRERQFTLAA